MGSRWFLHILPSRFIIRNNVPNIDSIANYILIHFTCKDDSALAALANTDLSDPYACLKNCMLTYNGFLYNYR